MRRLRAQLCVGAWFQDSTWAEMILWMLRAAYLVCVAASWDETERTSPKYTECAVTVVNWWPESGSPQAGAHDSQRPAPARLNRHASSLILAVCIVDVSLCHITDTQPAMSAWPAAGGPPRPTFRTRARANSPATAGKGRDAYKTAITKKFSDTRCFPWLPNSRLTAT